MQLNSVLRGALIGCSAWNLNTETFVHIHLLVGGFGRRHDGWMDGLSQPDLQIAFDDRIRHVACEASTCME